MESYRRLYVPRRWAVASTRRWASSGGHEPRAEEIALHQRFLTLIGQMHAAESEGDEAELRRLRPLLERARKRWLAANARVTRRDP